MRYINYTFLLGESDVICGAGVVVVIGCPVIFISGTGVDLVVAVSPDVVIIGDSVKYNIVR